MSESPQLRLLGSTDEEVAEAYDRAIWRRFLATLNETVAIVGVKRAAADLDTSPSQLKHALAERDRHYVKAEWIPYLVRQAPSHAGVQVLADVRHLEVVPRKPLTPEEELRNLKHTLREKLSAEIADALIDKARNG